MASAAALSNERIICAVGPVHRRSERDDGDMENTMARQRRCTRQQRVASEGEEREAQRPYVVDEIMGVKVECPKLLCKVRWHEYVRQDDTVGVRYRKSTKRNLPYYPLTFQVSRRCRETFTCRWRLAACCAVTTCPAFWQACAVLCCVARECVYHPARSRSSVLFVISITIFKAL